jgi:hypothetical protein
MIFVFLVFSILPHFAVGRVGSTRPTAQLQQPSGGIVDRSGIGLQDEGALVTSYPPLLAEMQVPIETSAKLGTTACDETGVPLDLSLMQWHGPTKRTTQTIVDCEEGVARVQVLWESFPEQVLRVTVPDEALRRTSLDIRMLVLSASGDSQEATYTLANSRPRGEQVILVPIAQASRVAPADPPVRASPSLGVN